MNGSKIGLILLSVALIITLSSSVFLYTQFNTKTSELEARTNELAAKDAELSAKTSELEAKNAELDAKNAELTGKNNELATKDIELAEKTNELAAKTVELDAKNAELEHLKEPKLTWDLPYSDYREEVGYHLTVTGTIINCGVTDVYNLRLHVLAYYVTGEIALNKTEPPGASEVLPTLLSGKTYEVTRWIYYEPGLIDTVTITPVWDLSR